MGGGLLGVLSPGEKRLTGKSFYLDNIKRRPAALLVEAIFHLGGKVESFLHKDVTFVVSGSQEASVEQKTPPVKKEAEIGGPAGTTHSPSRGGVQDARERPWPNTPRLPPRPTCFGSRGMALLEKAIRNNERLQGSTVLDNARSWGVQILYVDDILLYLQRLTRDSFNTKQKKAELKNYGKASAPVVKAACLKSPYLKVEDVSRKYKPLYVQSLTFPSFCSLGRFGPSEPLPSPCPEKCPEPEEKSKTKEPHKVSSGALNLPEPPAALRPSPWRTLNKLQGYCECCLEAFSNQEEHLVSDKHWRFLQETSNYSVLDQLVASLLPGFDPDPPQHTDPSLESFPPSACTPGPSASDLLTLSDGETEKAVSALLNPVAAFDTAFQSLHAKPPSPALPPDPQPITANPASHPPSTPILAALLAAPRPPSPYAALPSSDPPTLTPCSPLRLPPKLEPLSPCPHVSDQPSDPYSQPPVLSPQAPDYCYAPEPSVLYTDPPELSPEILTLPHQTPRDGDVCGLEADHEGGPPGVTEPTCCDISPAHARPALCRASDSAPLRGSQMASDSKKRGRSTSPRGRPTKRRRLGFSLDQQSYSKPESDTCVDLPAHPGPACTSTDFHVDPTCVASDPPGVLRLGEPLRYQESLPLSDSPSRGPVPAERLQDATNATFTSFVVPDAKVPPRPVLMGSHSGPGDQPPSPISANTPDGSFSVPTPLGSHHGQSSQCSHSRSSVYIDSALVPDLASISPLSSESDWDHELLSRLAPAGAAPADSLLPSARGRCGLDQELLHRPCTWMHNSSYEARLHSVLQPHTGRVL